MSSTYMYSNANSFNPFYQLYTNVNVSTAKSNIRDDSNFLIYDLNDETTDVVGYVRSKDPAQVRPNCCQGHPHPAIIFTIFYVLDTYSICGGTC